MNLIKLVYPLEFNVNGYRIYDGDVVKFSLFNDLICRDFVIYNPEVPL